MERKIAKKIMAMVFAAMLVMLMTAGTASATITVERLTQLTNDDYRATELDITSTDDPISIISAEWQDESDNMIVPYDSVDLKVTFKNNLPTTLHNVEVSIESGLCIWADYISSASALEHIGDVAPGREFSIMVPVIIAGVENSCIMNDIINPNGLGTLPLKVTMVTAHVRYDEGEWGDVFDTPTHYLEIQYPDFKPIVGDPDIEDADEDIDYYMQGDDDFSHTTDLLVRKYAVEAGAYYSNVFPDNPTLVSYSVFRYVDDILNPDYYEALATNDLTIVDLLDKNVVLNDPNGKGWICIGQAYLFTSLERTLGFPSREVTVAEGFPQIGPFTAYDQNGAAEVWFNDQWNFYNPWTSQSYAFEDTPKIDFDILKWSDLFEDPSPMIKFKGWYAFDKRTSNTFGKIIERILDIDDPSLLEGHDFTINPFGNPPSWCNDEWKSRGYGEKGGNIILAGSPIIMLIIDNQGKRVGMVPSIGMVNEIPDVRYMPPGQIGYSNKGDPLTSFELDEFFFLPEGLNGEYKLIITGTDNGEYTLQFAQFNPSAGEEYSDVTTFTNTIKENELHRYEVRIDDTINPIRIPPENEIPEFPNVAIPAVLILVVFLWLKRRKLK